MSGKELILQTVLKNQPPFSPLPDISGFTGVEAGAVENFINLFNSIGGKAIRAENLAEVSELLKKDFDDRKRWVTTLPELFPIAEAFSPAVDPHSFADIELTIIRAQFSVAENGASWFTEALMGHRILPFICQHLAVVVQASDIVPTMHEAYKIIGEGAYGFGTFIAGPSKTADIEQALVMGAHGPITMTVFVMK